MRNGMAHQQHENGMNSSSVIAMGNGGGGGVQQKVLHDNLHYAADSVSNAMSSLVRELNTGANSLARLSTRTEFVLLSLFHPPFSPHIAMIGGRRK